MPPTLTLAPWELPPDCDAPLSAPADYVFRAPWQDGFAACSQETEIRVRIVPYQNNFIHYFCGGPDSHDGNWVWSPIGTYEPVGPVQTEADALEAMFRNEPHFWRNKVMRLIYFEGTPYGFPGSHHATISPTGFCALSQGKVEFDLVLSQHRNRVQFELPIGRMGFSQRAATTKNRFLSLLSDERSEARFALEWLHLSPQQQRAKALRFERGNEAEAKAILRAALQSQTDIWDKGEPLIWRTRYDSEQNKGLPNDQDDFVFARHPLDWNTPEIAPRLNSWKRIVWSYFLPHLDSRLTEFASCVRESIGHNDGISTLSVEASPPTMHERLEAELLLHEWWDQKLKPLFFDTPTPH